MYKLILEDDLFDTLDDTPGLELKKEPVLKDLIVALLDQDKDDSKQNDKVVKNILKKK